jgi:HK97 family phage major capsid protein
MISSIQQRERVRNEMNALLASRGALGPHRTDRLESLLKEAASLDRGVAIEQEERYMQAFSTYLRGGRDVMTPQQRSLLRDVNTYGAPFQSIQRRDVGEVGLGTGFATGPGILVPVSFQDSVISSMRFAGPMLDEDVVSIERTSDGRSMPWPSDNDSLNTGFFVGENQQVLMEDPGGFGQTIFTSFKFSAGLIRLSTELIQDAQVNLSAYLARIFGVRLGRILNNKLTGGAGSTEPTGFYTASSSAGVAVGGSLNDGSSAGNSLSTADCSTLVQALDPAYRMSPNTAFQAHPNTIETMRRLMTKEGAPAFLGLHNSPDGVDRVLNFKILPNPQMDVLQTTASSPQVTRRVLAFGAWDRYQVRLTPMWISRLTQRFAEVGQVAFLAWVRCDGNIVDSGSPIKYLTTVF